MTLTLARFTQLARLPMGRCAGSSPLRRMPSVGSRQGAGSLPCSTAKGSGWEPDGVTLQVRFCEEPGTNRRMAEILRHRRETRRQSDKANVCLNVGKEPAYFPTTFSCFSDRSLPLNLCLAISAGLFNVCKQIINRRVAEQATSLRCIVSMPCLGLLQKSNHANEPHVLTKNSYPCYSDLFLRHRLRIQLHTVACNQVRGFSMLTFIIASRRFAARTSLSSVDKKTSASALSAQAI